MSKSRNRTLVTQARQITMYLLRELTECLCRRSASCSVGAITPP